MSEQVSSELLKALNEITENEATTAKIDASIFIRTSQEMVREKIECLYNMLKVEAKYCEQKQDSHFDDVELIITHYKQKLHMVYDEFYCQYVNIQNEIQEAKTNSRIGIINYQKLVNENNDNKELKESIKKKNELYKEIVRKCELKFKENKEKFEKMINEEFKLASKSLQIINEQNVFQRLFSRISNIFKGGKKYLEILKQYNKLVNNIDSYELVEQMREDTVEFVADIIEMKGIEDDGLEEVRIGGKYGGN